MKTRSVSQGAKAGRWQRRCAPISALLSTLLFLLGSSHLHADTLDDIRQRGELLWGADAEGGGPFVFPRDDNPREYQGFEYQIAELLAERLGVRARFVQGQWDKLPDLLHRGDIDLVLNGYEWKPAWSGRFGTTLPYYVYQLQMLVRTDESRFVDREGLRRWGLDHPDDKPRVAVLGGSAADAYVRDELGDAVELVIYDGSTDAMRAVELDIDGVDATIQDLPVVTFYASRFDRLKRLGTPFAPGFYVILVRPEDEALLRVLNAAILELWQNGRLPAVLQQYGLWNDVQRQRGLLTDERGNFRPDPPAVGVQPQAHVSAPSRWNTVRGRIPLLLQGALITILLSVSSMPLAVIAGLFIALGRMYGPTILSRSLGFYVELVRGTPLVLQLYLIFFVLPEIGISLPAIVAGVLGLAINYSAYEAEIYRAGLQAVPRGQFEAAQSLGMSRGLALRRIIVPQAVRLVIPPVMNDFIALFKDTAVCSVITVVELSKQYYIHAQSAQAVLELGLITAMLYLAMSYPLALLVGRYERRLAAGPAHD